MLVISPSATTPPPRPLRHSRTASPSSTSRRVTVESDESQPPADWEDPRVISYADVLFSAANSQYFTSSLPRLEYRERTATRSLVEGDRHWLSSWAIPSSGCPVRRRRVTLGAGQRVSRISP